MSDPATILVIDDEPQLRQLTARVLERAGYEVSEAENGLEGLRLARQRRPDLVLLDVMLPDVNGLEVCRRLKADPAMAGTFVVMLSGALTLSDDQAAGLDAGADEYMARPIGSREMVARIAAILRLQRVEAALRQRTEELNERIRHLDCLYGVATIVGRTGASMAEILHGTVRAVRAAFHDSSLAEARIVIDGQTYESDGFCETGPRLAADILVYDRLAGQVEVCYREQPADRAGGPFSVQERQLLDLVAWRLGKTIEGRRIEEAHRRSEEKLRSLVVWSRDGIALTDETGRITDWNAAMEQIIGLPASRAVGRYLWDVQSEMLLPEARTPDYLQQIEAAARPALETGQAPWLGRLMVREFLHPDGSRRALEETAFSIPTAAGFLIATVARDVTERRKAELELRLKDQAITSSVNAIAFADLDGRLTYANPACLALWGYDSLGEVVGRPVTSFWRDPEAATGLLGVVREKGASISEMVGLRKDGVPLDILSSASLVTDQAGAPVALMASFVDITHRKRADAALLLNQQRLQSLLDLAHVAERLSEQEIIEHGLEEMVRLTRSENGYFHFLNSDQNTIRLTAWSRATLAACTAAYHDHYPLEEAGLWADSARLRASVVHNEFQALTTHKGYPAGHPRLVRHLGVCVIDNGVVVALCGVGNKETDYDDTDVQQMQLLADSVWRIVQRKRSEQMIRDSLREKEVLLKEIHHRVKNNLQIISSLLDMQSLYIADPAAVQVLQDSRNRVRAMSSVHERLYQSADLSSINLADYLDSVATSLMITHGASSRDVRLTTCAADVRLEIDIAIPCGLIVNELVSNALRHAFPPGWKDGQVALEIGSGPEGDVSMCVRDTGIGLPAGIDLDESPSLGLRLVSMLVQQLRGTLVVERNGGTAFRIHFPVQKRPPGARPG